MLAPYFRVAEIRADPGRHEYGGRPVQSRSRAKLALGQSHLQVETRRQMLSREIDFAAR